MKLFITFIFTWLCILCNAQEEHIFYPGYIGRIVIIYNHPNHINEYKFVDVPLCGVVKTKFPLITHQSTKIDSFWFNYRDYATPINFLDSRCKIDSTKLDSIFVFKMEVQRVLVNKKATFVRIYYVDTLKNYYKYPSQAKLKKTDLIDCDYGY